MMRNLNVFLLLLGFIVVEFPTGSNAALKCPKGFELHGNKCYVALDVSASWPEAKQYCAVLGGKLAAIGSDYEQTIISGIMFKMHGTVINEYYWLDGSDILNEREWRWMGANGDSVPFSFTFWGPGQPDNTKERCLEIRYDWRARWNNAQCSLPKSIICEARATGTGREIIDDILQDP